MEGAGWVDNLAEQAKAMERRCEELRAEHKRTGCGALVIRIALLQRCIRDIDYAIQEQQGSDKTVYTRHNANKLKYRSG